MCCIPACLINHETGIFTHRNISMIPTEPVATPDPPLWLEWGLFGLEPQPPGQAHFEKMSNFCQNLKDDDNYWVKKKVIN